MTTGSTDSGAEKKVAVVDELEPYSQMAKKASYLALSRDVIEQALKRLGKASRKRGKAKASSRQGGLDYRVDMPDHVAKMLQLRVVLSSMKASQMLANNQAGGARAHGQCPAGFVVVNPQDVADHTCDLARQEGYPELPGVQCVLEYHYKAGLATGNNQVLSTNWLDRHTAETVWRVGLTAPQNVHGRTISEAGLVEIYQELSAVPEPGEEWTGPGVRLIDVRYRKRRGVPEAEVATDAWVPMYNLNRMLGVHVSGRIINQFFGASVEDADGCAMRGPLRIAVAADPATVDLGAQLWRLATYANLM
ncbi:hypothetical protein EV182_001373 [Spiromyces aspiralis]|uniref:Uncharacterized protein n=1 Tax=Spiromyces aspiralis TaxID=68401 RepID=A0ACC1HWS0_9FUNG|nr:hypothetical protein EV182_001373 [Spiromyces aspiralis]